MSQIQLPQNQVELAEVLKCILVPRTEVVQKATAVLKVFMKDVGCLQPMFSAICESEDEKVRYVAAVVLRSKINTHWRKLDSGERDQIKEVLLNRLVAETHRGACIAVASLVGALAKQELPTQTWDQLFQFFEQMSQHENERHREVASMLIYHIATTIPEEFRPHMTTMVKLFEVALQDPTCMKVRINALKSFTHYLSVAETDDEVEAFAGYVPLVVEFTKHCLENTEMDDAETATGCAIEVLDSLMVLNSRTLDEQFEYVINFLTDVLVTDADIEVFLREKAQHAIISFVATKPALVCKTTLVSERLLPSVFMVFCKASSNAGEVTDVSFTSIASTFLTGLLANLPSVIIVEECLQMCLEHLNADNILQKRAALLALAAMPDAVTIALEDHVESIIDLVSPYTQFPDDAVSRKAAFLVLTQLADHMEESMVPFAHTVLEVSLACLDNAGEQSVVKRQAVTCLGVVTQHIPKDQMMENAEPLVSKLLQFLSSEDMKLVEGTICAISNVARTTEEAFIPLFEQTYQALIPFLTITDGDGLNLRAFATDAIGAMGHAVGQDLFVPLLDAGLMEQVKLGFNINYHLLNELTFTFFQSISQMMGADIERYVDLILPLILNRLMSTEGLDEGNDDELHTSINNSLYDSDEELDEADLIRRVDLSIRTGAVDEMLAALAALNYLMESMKGRFASFIIGQKKSYFIMVLQHLEEFLNEDVRSSTIGCYDQALMVLSDHYQLTRKWEQGELLEIPDEMEDVLELIMMSVVQGIFDKSSSVVNFACQAITEACDNMGLIVIAPHMARVSESLMKILVEKHVCQARYEDDTLDEHKDHDALYNSATDLLAKLTEVGGHMVAPLVHNAFPALGRFMNPGRPSYTKMTAVGCAAEIVDYLGQDFEQFADAEVIQAALSLLHEELAVVRRNACYFAGRICKVGSEEMLNNYVSSIVEALQQSMDAECDDQDSDGLACRDNATSALCLVLERFGQQLSFDHLATAVLQHIPLREDMAEAEIVYSFVGNLMGSHPQLVQPHLVNVVQSAVSIILNEEVSDEVRQMMAEILGSIASKDGDVVQSVLSQLSNEEQQFVRNAL